MLIAHFFVLCTVYHLMPLDSKTQFIYQNSFPNILFKWLPVNKLCLGSVPCLAQYNLARSRQSLLVTLCVYIGTFAVGTLYASSYCMTLLWIFDSPTCQYVTVQWDSDHFSCILESIGGLVLVQNVTWHFMSVFRCHTCYDGMQRTLLVIHMMCLFSCTMCKSSTAKYNNMTLNWIYM